MHSRRRYKMEINGQFSGIKDLKYPLHMTMDWSHSRFACSRNISTPAENRTPLIQAVAVLH
jgi:hypothetical protein